MVEYSGVSVKHDYLNRKHQVQHSLPRKIEALLLNPAIICNRLKVNAAVSNAEAFIKIQEEL